MRRSHEGRTIVGLFDIACFSMVEYPSLDPQKKWNVLSREMFSSQSGRLVDLAKSISKLFPDEIRNFAAREIQPTASESVQKHQTPDRNFSLRASSRAWGLDFCWGREKNKNPNPEPESLLAG